MIDQDSPRFISPRQARVALDSMDDFARMNIGVDAHGPRGVLEQFIEQAERYESAQMAAPVYDVAAEKLAVTSG